MILIKLTEIPKVAPKQGIKWQNWQQCLDRWQQCLDRWQQCLDRWHHCTDTTVTTTVRNSVSPCTALYPYLTEFARLWPDYDPIMTILVIKLMIFDDFGHKTDDFRRFSMNFDDLCLGEDTRRCTMPVVMYPWHPLPGYHHPCPLPTRYRCHDRAWPRCHHSRFTRLLLVSTCRPHAPFILSDI